MRLTPEALGKLQSTLTERWQNGDGGGKLTRETRAELLGVSVATAGRILAGSGVDRATLAMAYKSLGIPWDEGFCLPVDSLAELRTEDAIRNTFGADNSEDGHLAAEESKRMRRRSALGVAVLGIATATIYVTYFTGLSTSAERAWITAYTRYALDAEAKYHNAQYAEARDVLQRAIALARDHDASARLSGAMRLDADIVAAQGDLPTARDLYRKSILIRDIYAQDHTKPSIYEALGDVETRMGDYENAERSLKLSLAGYKSFNERAGMAAASRSLGALAYRRSKFRQAEFWYLNSLEEAKGLDQEDLRADVRGQRALVMLKLGQKTKARDALSECLTYWTAKRHGRWVALCQLRLGLAEAELGHLTLATRLMSQSRDGYQRVGDKIGTGEAAGHLRRFRSTAVRTFL